MAYLMLCFLFSCFHFTREDLYLYSYILFANVLVLSDHIFEEILYSTTDELKDARMKLEEVVRRCLLKCVGETRITQAEYKDKRIFKVQEDILQFIWTNHKSVALMQFIYMLLYIYTYVCVYM